MFLHPVGIHIYIHIYIHVYIHIYKRIKHESSPAPLLRVPLCVKACASKAIYDAHFKCLCNRIFCRSFLQKGPAFVGLFRKKTNFKLTHHCISINSEATCDAHFKCLCNTNQHAGAPCDALHHRSLYCCSILQCVALCCYSTAACCRARPCVYACIKLLIDQTHQSPLG